MGKPSICAILGNTRVELDDWVAPLDEGEIVLLLGAQGGYPSRVRFRKAGAIVLGRLAGPPKWEANEETLRPERTLLVLGGEWEINDLSLAAYGAAKVIARGKAEIEAHDRVRIEARDSSRVFADGKAWVTAMDLSYVVARGAASVFAGGHARVVATDQTAVEAVEQATVDGHEGTYIVAQSHDVTVRVSASYWGVLIPPPPRRQATTERHTTAAGG